jgi:hypothetical protein
MPDPRDIAHDKKLRQEKKKHDEEIAPAPTGEKLRE